MFNHIISKVPELTMQDDNGPISALVWANKSEIITCSWDHHIKLWDPELGGSKQKILGNKAFLDIDYSQLNKTIISASVDKIIRLYDPRSTGKSTKNAALKFNMI